MLLERVFFKIDLPSAKEGLNMAVNMGEASVNTFDEILIADLSGPTSSIKSPEGSIS